MDRDSRDEHVTATERAIITLLVLVVLLVSLLTGLIAYLFSV